MVHTFLLRWLSSTQKQRRFPRSVAPDIESLLKLGRQKGHATGLHQRLEYFGPRVRRPSNNNLTCFG
ncbi:DUF2913 family protein [Pseudescherichia vulneris]